MNLLFARQPFVPAILTLILLASIGLWHDRGISCAPVDEALSVECSSSLDAPASAIDSATLAPQGLLIRLPGDSLRDWQGRHPVGARWLGLLLILMMGISIGRMPMDLNLYGVSTCLGIPLLGILLGWLSGGMPALEWLAALMLLASAMRRYSRTYRNTYCFDELFHASVYLGMLVALRPAAWPLLLLPPYVCLLFRRTRREMTVTLCGLLLVPALLCYINWGCGGGFFAPVEAWWRVCTQGIPGGLFRISRGLWLVALGGLFLLDMVAVCSIVIHMYAVGSKPRFALIHHIGVLVLAFLLLCGPSATEADAAFAAIPSAALLPFLFVRMHPLLFSLCYLLMLAGTLCRLFL